MTAVLCTIFFISGASALIFEILWFRQAGLAFGNSVWASSLVLSGFMAGLALGNVLAARTGDRLARPIQFYGLIEGIIAVSGTGLVYFLPTLGPAIAPWVRPFLETPWILNSLRLCLAFLLLLIPSTAMGMTLPLLVKALSIRDPLFGRVLGRLYGWNTLGAVTGVILAEFALIGTLGIYGTAWFAAVCNLGVTAIALWLTQMTERIPGKRSAVGRDVALGWRFGGRYLTAVFGTGFCLLALEVIWFRFLLLFVSAQSESFALILGIILTGIALGGLAAARWLSRRPAFERRTDLLAFLAGAFCVLTYGLFPWFMAPFGAGPFSKPSVIVAVALPLMLPVSFLSGALFTHLGAALRQHLVPETATVGVLTFFNTIGAAVGSLTAGFVLLPLAGIEASFFLIAALYGTLGALLMDRHPGPRLAGYAGPALFGLSVVLFPFGAMEKHHLPIPIKRFLSPEGGRVAAVREGLIETISYLEEHWAGKPISHRLLTNAFSMSSSDLQSRRYMKLFVYWPVAVHPEPRRALLISYGIGSTAKALTDTPSLETIDVVDISRDILEMNRIVFPDPADHPLMDPRVRVHVEDARYFLQTTDQRFDLITGEPPPPEIAGVVNLYTEEYFRLIYDRLAEGGMVTYWLPLHAIRAESVKSIVRAFCNVFEDCSLWHGQFLDLMMAGTRNADGPVSKESFLRQWRDPVVSEELEALGLERPEQLGALFIGDAAYLDRITRDTPPLVDRFPKRITTSTTARQEMVRLIDAWINVTESKERFRQSHLIRRLWPEGIRSATLPYFSFQDILYQYWFGRMTGREPGMADLHRVLTESTLRAPALWILGSQADRQRIVSASDSNEQADPLLKMHLGIGRIVDRDFVGALEPLAMAEADPKLRDAAFRYRIYALCMAGRIDQAQTLVEEQMAAFLRHQAPMGSPSGPLRLPPRNLSPYWTWMKQTFGIDPLRGV